MSASFDEGHQALQQFDRQRRLIATQVIAWVFGGLLSLLTVAFISFAIQGNFNASPPSVTIATTFMLILCVSAYGLGAFSARQGKLRLASVSTILAANGSIILTTTFWAFLLGKGLSPVLLTLLGSCSVVIVLAGTIGEAWMIIATTIVMNILTLGLSFFAPATQPGFDLSHSIEHLIKDELLLLTILALSIQWAIATITLITARNYQRTMGELGKAYGQVQQLDGLKDHFITNINHELRTPIMTLQSYVEYLRMVRKKLSPEDENAMFDRASRASHNLVALLTSILDIRRLDESAEAFTPAVVNILDTFNNAIMAIDPREGTLEDRKLLLSIPHSFAIWGESVRLQQIFVNLLSNAIKYSPSGTPIEVSAHNVPLKARKYWTRRHASVVESPMVEILVQDHGLGIPPDQVPLLFNRFVRLERDLASTVIGNGLGLYLCKTLALAMKGNIWVESSGIPGEGSTFHLTLPTAHTVSPNDPENETQPRVRVYSPSGG